MNISWGGAVSPSTKRGRSPHMPEGSAAASRGVAQSRVGKQVRKAVGRQGGRLVPSPRRGAWPATRRQQCCDGQVNKQAMPSVELKLTVMVRHQRSEMHQ